MSKKWILILNSLVVVRFVVLNQYVIHVAKEHDRQLTGLLNEVIVAGNSLGDKLVDCRARLSEHDALSRATEQVAAVPYENPGANRYDHSKALVKMLADAGIESSIFVNADRSHAWVAV